jgi:hypothetical protein
VGTFHGQEHAETCMTLYQLADLLQLHPASKENFNKEMLSPVQVCSRWLNSSTIMQIDIDANRREGQVFFMS